VAETSKTVDHAARLLVAVRNAGPESTTELAKRLELSRTVTTRLIATLEAHDLVRRTDEGVALGFGLLDLAAGLASGVRQAATPQLQDLAVRFRETAVLALADHDSAVAVDQVLPDRRVMRVHYQSGLRHSLVEAAHGRAMLAHLESAATRLLAERTDAARLHAELETVRRRGWALSHDELESGITGVASPVFDGRGTAIASIGLVAPTGRFPGERSVGPAVREAADMVSAAIAAPAGFGDVRGRPNGTT